MNFFSVADGSRLGFEDAGTGIPVVFLHPTPLDHDYWRPLLVELPGVRAIVPDLRGHGRSELGDRMPIGGFARVSDTPVLSMRLLAADTIALLDHLGIDEAVFVGCSIGGYVMLDLWRRASERMSGLAFICSKPQPDAEAALHKRVENIERARNEGVEGLFDGMAQTLVGATTRRTNPEMVTELRAHMTLTPEALVAVQAGLATRPNSVPTVGTIRVPVLAIAGGEDATVAPDDMRAFRAAPGQCQFHLLPDAGHFAAYEQPAKVGEIIAGWLRRFER